MTSELTLPNREEINEIIEYIFTEAKEYLKEVDSLNVRQSNIKPLLKEFETELPQIGQGGLATMKKLIEKGLPTTVASSGPRFFHFVVGGVTPAALGAEWMTAVTDQIAYAYVTSPLAVKLELIALDWLKDLFGIPKNWGAVMTTGASMAIYVGLISARQWVGEQYDKDIFEEGLLSIPEFPIFTSNLLHASDTKVVGMLGMGRTSIQNIADEKTGAFDLQRLEEKLIERKGKPSIIIAVVGEPNAGLFDQVPELTKLARKYNAWLHVDGAFGLFAKLDPRTTHLLDNLSQADSITVDGHKWLNVPYDCGFGFVRDRSLMEKSFRYAAEYLPNWSEDEPVLGVLGPESSRKARSFSVWATLNAYGKSGVSALISKNMDQARYLAELVTKNPDLELLEEVVINVVCFRYHPQGQSEDQLNRLNQELGKKILEDGRVYLGTTTYKGKIALRPAIVNWRTETSDIDFMIKVILELAHQILT